MVYGIVNRVDVDVGFMRSKWYMMGYDNFDIQDYELLWDIEMILK